MIIILILILILCLVYIFIMCPRLKKPEYEDLLKYHYAHRGLHNNDSDAPENSLSAFRKAVENGYGIELDVQLTKDDKLVVFHDGTLSRVCGIDKKLCDYTYDELCTIKLCNSDEHIPLFEDVLNLVDGQVPLIVEVKFYTDVNHVCEKTMELLNNYEGRYCVESFNPLAVMWFKKHYPKLLRGQLSSNFKEDAKKNETAGRKYDLSAFLTRHLLTNLLARPDFIAYNCLYKDAFSRKVCKALGSLCVTYTIKSEAELKSCYDDFDIFIFQDFIPELPAKSKND